MVQRPTGLGFRGASPREQPSTHRGNIPRPLQGRFAAELDFVTANVIMAIIADFMLVWLPAPTMSFASARACAAPRNAIARFFSCCPDNAFQKVPKVSPSL
jgi:Protein RETICULATA-related